MRDPFAAPQFDEVLAARDAIATAQGELVSARRRLWKSALDCGLVRPANAFADRSGDPESLVEAVAGRSDPGASRLREAYAELRAAEQAASAANDALALALGRLRAALPRGEQRAELAERLMGHPGRQLHRLHVLEDPKGHARVASHAVCGRRRSALWRLAQGRPVDIQLCPACRESRPAFPGETDEVQTGLPVATPARRVVDGFQVILLRVAWRGLPIAAIAGCLLVAGTLFDVSPVAHNPLGEFVVGQVGKVIGAR